VFVAPIFELTLIGVAEPNVPNRERVIIRPTQLVDLTEFGVLIGYRNDAGALIPLWDQFYWFGNVTVSPPSWICLYTGSGIQGTVPGSGEIVHNFYWNRGKTVFVSERFVPMVFRIGGLIAGPLLQPPMRSLGSG
jgi:hypothetical protein